MNEMLSKHDTVKNVEVWRSEVEGCCRCCSGCQIDGDTLRSLRLRRHPQHSYATHAASLRSRRRKRGEEEASCVILSRPLTAHFCKLSEFHSRLETCSRLRNESVLTTCKSTNAGDQQTFLQTVAMDTVQDNVHRFKAIMRVCNVNTARLL